MPFLDLMSTRLRSLHTPSLYISQYIFLNVSVLTSVMSSTSLSSPFPFPFLCLLTLSSHLFSFHATTLNTYTLLKSVYITILDYLDKGERSFKENRLESIGSWQNWIYPWQ